jgi:hypothetical protein
VSGYRVIVKTMDCPSEDQRGSSRAVAQRRPIPPGLLEGVVCRVLGVRRVAQDRAGQAVGGVEMVVRQAQEGLFALGRRLGHGGPAVCHLDDLGRSPHDDMTIQRGETFTPEFDLGRDGSRNWRTDQLFGGCSPE